MELEVKFQPTDVRIVTEEELKWAESLLKKNLAGNTLCDVIREIYVLAEGREDIRKRCMVVMAYAKRMDRKLGEYKSKERKE